MKPRRHASEGPTLKQRCALVAAKSGKLFLTRDGLRMRHPGHKTMPVRMFGPGIVKSCIKSGWAMEMDQGDGEARIMTTVAGDAVLAKPLRLVRPRSLWQDEQRDALR